MTLTKDELSLEGGTWYRAEPVPATSFICGFCGDKVSSDRGYWASRNPNGAEPISYIRICPSCQGPSVFTRSLKRFPGSAPGNPVSHVPDELSKLYNEARSSAAAGAYTASVLCCRKMLMNIAVEKGAKEGETFVKYVQHLASQGYIPPNGQVWVDYIRQRGNEATHEIALMSEQDAIALITFVEMLLRFIYEFPNKVPAAPATP